MKSSRQTRGPTRPGTAWLLLLGMMLGSAGQMVWGEAAEARFRSSRRSRRALARVRPKLARELKRKGLRLGSPIFVRIFKRPPVLEMWVKRGAKFRLFRSYRICALDPRLGPKVRRYDGRSPEGFYFVNPGRMNPWSSYHLSMDVGYPNRYDRHHGRTGSALMIHGQCVTAGCYAMTNRYINEIWAMADAALRGGQRFFRVHVFPFRLTAANLRRHRRSRWYGFWRNLRAGYVYFERRRRPPDVRVRRGKYVFR